MPLFQIGIGHLVPIPQVPFLNEKKLQALIESNLAAVFSCRFVASEYATGAMHGGRIDTLALSEDNNPVIIEYKKVESSELVNQSLFYLSWLSDHHGDFEVAAQRALGSGVAVDWSDIRVICIAPNYKKYDLHAVQMMGANIELWTYRLFKNDSLYLEEVLQRLPQSRSDEPAAAARAKGLSPGKKAWISRATGSYTFEQHLEGRPQQVRDLALEIDDFIRGLDPSIQAAPKKLYVAYKLAQNFVCMEVQRKQVLLYLKLDPKVTKGLPGITRDVTDIGHFGTGNLEATLRTPNDFEAAKPLVESAYQRIGS